MIEASAPKPVKTTRFRVVAAIVIAVAVAFVVWLVARPGDNKPNTPSARTEPVAASVATWPAWPARSSTSSTGWVRSPASRTS